MRIRNISMGRCGHRPLQTTTKNQQILKGGQSRPPLQPATMNRNVFRFSPRRGRCPHRPIPPPKRECPRVGADGRYCTGFRFSPLQMRVKNRTGQAKNRRVFHSAPQGRKLDKECRKHGLDTKRKGRTASALRYICRAATKTGLQQKPLNRTTYSDTHARAA